MRFPRCEFGFENSRSATRQPAAPSAASEAPQSKSHASDEAKVYSWPGFKRARTRSMDPDRVWQVLLLIIIAVVLVVAKVM